MTGTKVAGRVVAFMCLVLIVPLAVADEPPRPVEVLVLGTYHMANPGLDLHNIQVDPVTTDQKQAQIQAVVDAIARFRPTVVALERVAGDPATLLDQKYPTFQPADLRSNPDERVQVAYRLANQLKLSRVYAIDEQAAEHEPSYFPYDKLEAWAKQHGRMPELDAAHGRIGVEMARKQLDQQRLSVAQLLFNENLPDAQLGGLSHGQLYYKNFLTVGAGHEQPGADLNGRWYTRNAKIFAKLMQVAQPGDRIVVVYGSGHNYWLRHFAATTPGCLNVDPLTYLRQALPEPPK